MYAARIILAPLIKNRLRLLWLLLTSTEFSLQKWFFFFLCHTQLPPLEVRLSCNRRYSVILFRGWYSYSYKVSSYCQQTQIINQPTVHQLLSHYGRRSGCSSLSWFPLHEHKVTHEQMLVHICPESAGKTPDLLIWKDFKKQVSTVSWFWQSWFCQIWSDKRRKIRVSRESKKLLERRIISLSLIFVIRDEVGQPDRIRRNRDLSPCSSEIQSATWLPSHTQLSSVFVGAGKRCFCVRMKVKLQPNAATQMDAEQTWRVCRRTPIIIIIIVVVRTLICDRNPSKWKCRPLRPLILNNRSSTPVHNLFTE